MHILLPVDGSEASAQSARLVASHQGGPSRPRPLLLNVQRRPLHLSPEATVDWAVLDQAFYTQGESELAPARELLCAAGFAAEGLVRLGHAADTILEVAKGREVDAIVMGTRGHGLLRGFALGSVALRVAMAAECPVLLVKPDSRLPARFGLACRVVAPVDGSPASLDAVRRLVAMRGMLGTLAVDLVHFQPALTIAAAIAPPHDDVLQRWSGKASEQAVAAARQLLADANIAHEVHRLAGDPATSIGKFAEQRQADLVAMAPQGHGALRHLALGSVSLKTVHESHVPVALMR